MTAVRRKQYHRDVGRNRLQHPRRHAELFRIELQSVRPPGRRGDGDLVGLDRLRFQQLDVWNRPRRQQPHRRSAIRKPWRRRLLSGADVARHRRRRSRHSLCAGARKQRRARQSRHGRRHRQRHPERGADGAGAHAGAGRQAAAGRGDDDQLQHVRHHRSGSRRTDQFRGPRPVGENGGGELFRRGERRLFDLRDQRRHQHRQCRRHAASGLPERNLRRERRRQCAGPDLRGRRRDLSAHAELRRNRRGRGWRARLQHQDQRRHASHEFRHLQGRRQRRQHGGQPNLHGHGIRRGRTHHRTRQSHHERSDPFGRRNRQGDGNAGDRPDRPGAGLARRLDLADGRRRRADRCARQWFGDVDAEFHHRRQCRAGSRDGERRFRTVAALPRHQCGECLLHRADQCREWRVCDGAGQRPQFRQDPGRADGFAPGPAARLRARAGLDRLHRRRRLHDAHRRHPHGGGFRLGFRGRPAGDLPGPDHGNGHVRPRQHNQRLRLQLPGRVLRHHQRSHADRRLWRRAAQQLHQQRRRHRREFDHFQHGLVRRYVGQATPISP